MRCPWHWILLISSFCYVWTSLACFHRISQYSRTCVLQPPLGLKKVAVVQKVAFLTGCSYKLLSILENCGSGGPLFGGGCYHRFDFISFWQGVTINKIADPFSVYCIASAKIRTKNIRNKSNWNIVSTNQSSNYGLNK